MQLKGYTVMVCHRPIYVNCAVETSLFSAVSRATFSLSIAYINYAPMRIGTENPWALTELAKAGGPEGGSGGTPI